MPVTAPRARGKWVWQARRALTELCSPRRSVKPVSENRGVGDERFNSSAAHFFPGGRGPAVAHTHRVPGATPGPGTDAEGHIDQRAESSASNAEESRFESGCGY